jgi:hypothetical protein
VTFSVRFPVHWWTSEKQGDSVIPVSFWYWSTGGSMIIFIFRRDPFGQLDPAFEVAHEFLEQPKRVAAIPAPTSDCDKYWQRKQRGRFHDSRRVREHAGTVSLNANKFN